MKIDLSQVKLISADKNNEDHKKDIWKVFNENIEFFHLTKKPISFEEHSKWWETIFDKELIFVILYESNVCGYIRLTKIQTKTKNKHEISIALLKKYQNVGMGTYSYKMFENEMKKLGINEIIAYTEIENKKGQKFFEKNEFGISLKKFIKKI